MTKDEALTLALEAYIKAGVGNSTDFVLQGKAYDLAIGALAQPTSADYARGYCEGFNDACKLPSDLEPV